MGLCKTLVDKYRAHISMHLDVIQLTWFEKEVRCFRLFYSSEESEAQIATRLNKWFIDYMIRRETWEDINEQFL